MTSTEHRDQTTPRIPNSSFRDGPRRTPAIRRLRIEPLEDRRLLSFVNTTTVDEFAPGARIIRTETQLDPEAQSGEIGPDDNELNGQGLEFNLIPAAGMAQDAIDGFQEAADLFSGMFTDDILVNIDIDFRTLDPGVLGRTSSTRQTNAYSAVRTALTVDQSSADDTTAVGTLPGGTNLDIYINRTSNSPHGSGSATPYVDNDGDANNTTVRLTTANAKSLGLLAAGYSASDAGITFSDAYTWDFDRSDGISAGAFDFVGVAAHEIGHAMGFTSGVDVLDKYSQPVNGGPFPDDQFTWVSPLDLYRFSSGSISAGADIDWTADTRSKYFSIDGGATNLAALSTGREFGDGEQASHWKDNLDIGIMDPTGAPGEFMDFTDLDVMAWDVIGWDPPGDDPEINVQGNGLDIADGDTTPSTADHTDFGNTNVSGETVIHTFTIQNTGIETEPLQLTGADPVSITGVHSADFEVVSQPGLLTLDPGQSTTFDIEFAPLVAGTRTATINVASDDPDENPYDFAVQGEATVSGIDLLGTDFEVVTENLAVAAGQVDTNLSVRNLGDTDAGAFDVKFYLSDDAVIDPAVDLPLDLDPTDPNYDIVEPSAYHVAGGLASLNTHFTPVSLSLPVTDPFGTDNDYYLGMFVDADLDVIEADETNNLNRGQGLDLDDVDYGFTTAAVPFFEGWEAGPTFADWWEVIEGDVGRIQITPDNGPYEGSYHVTLDDTDGDDGLYSLNQLILHIDLAGRSGVELGFANREWGDEDHDEDAVEISVDGGANWHTIVSLTEVDSTTTYTERVYDVDSLGLTYSPDTMIRFQQYDNYPITTDGMAFDNIRVSTAVEGIDLLGTNFDVVADNLAAAAGQVDTSLSVRNLGDTDAGAFDVKFYLSDDAVIDPAVDLPLDLDPTDPNYDGAEPSVYHVAGGLASLNAHSATIALAVPVTDPFGTDNDYYLGMFVDADLDVVEADETNNLNRGQGLDLDDVNYGFAVAAFPFLEDWESGEFAQYWEVVEGTEGRVQVTSANDPYAGNYHVTLDDAVDESEYSLNQLILHIDLAGRSGVELGYANREWNDEPHAEDVVEISVDGGATWHTVVSLAGAESTETYTERAYDLDSLGLTYSPDTMIRFQQYDNYSIGSDGMALDNIRIAPRPPLEFERLEPLGGAMSVSRDNIGSVSAPGDVAQFEFFIEGGETVAAIVTPVDPAAVMEVSVNGDPWTPAVPAGESAVLPPTTIADDGTVTVLVRGNLATEFTLDVYRNAALEALVGDTSDGSELAIDGPQGSNLPLPGEGGRIDERFGVIGTSTPEGGGGGDELIVNGGFETGDFTAWTAIDNGLGQMTPWTVDGAGGGFYANNAPLGGSFDAYNGFTGDAGLEYELYQDVVIPAGHSAALTTNHRIQYDSFGITSSLDHLFEISIRDTANNVLQTLYTENITANGATYTDLGWNTQVFDVSAFAGQTVRVHFFEYVPESYSAALNIEFDDISLIVGDGGDTVPDVDEYTIDLSGKVDQPIDVILAGQQGADFSGETLELLDVDGTTVLATATPDPLGVAADNFDLGILDFAVPADGVYTLRLSSIIEGEYGLVVTDPLTFDTEPNDGMGDPLRTLGGTRRALGYLDGSDLYTLDLSAGQTVRIWTETPLDDPATSPANGLNPALAILDAVGLEVAADADSLDGKNAEIVFSASQDGAHFLRVDAEQGGGEYLLNWEFHHAVVGRHVVYNNSAFDGDDPSINAEGDNAIATDKTALLPGQPASWANYTNYDRGINGIAVDIVGLQAGPGLVDTWGGAGDDRAFAVATDDEGNVYVAGNFEQTIDLAPNDPAGELTSMGSADVFLAKYDADGALVWARHFGGSGYDEPRGGVAVGDDGHVFVSGFFLGDDFDAGAGVPLPNAGYMDVFVARFDADGNHVWSRSFGGAGDGEDLPLGMDIDSAGNLVVAGGFSGEVDFDPGTEPGEVHLMTSAGGLDAFVMKLDGTGTLVWAERIGGLQDDRFPGVAVGPADDVRLALWFQDAVDVDPGPGERVLASVSTGAGDSALVRLDAAGDYLNAAQVRSTHAESGVLLWALDASDNGVTYLAGAFYGTIDAAPGTAVAELSSIAGDGFVLRLDADNELTWVRQIAGEQDVFPFDLKWSVDGNIYVGGIFDGVAEFDSGGVPVSLESAGGEDVFLVAFDESGNLQSADRSGGAGDEFAWSIAVATGGGALVAGSFAQDAVFQSGALRQVAQSQGQLDAFVLRATEDTALRFPTANDFAYRTGNNSDPSSWTDGPSPTEFVVGIGEGVDDSDRVVIGWDDYAIVNSWLQITVLANDHTGLRDDDVFYFGNAVGETGNSDRNALVTAADVIAIRDNQRGAGNRAGITTPYDVNRDRRVDATDLLLARNHATGPFSALRLIAAPLPNPPAAPVEGERMLPAEWADAPMQNVTFRSTAALTPEPKAQAIDQQLGDWQRIATVIPFERRAGVWNPSCAPTTDSQPHIRALGRQSIEAPPELSSTELDDVLVELLSVDWR